MYIKWSLIMLSKGLMFVYSFFVYPVAFFFRKPVRDAYLGGNDIERVLAFPLWITLDDENDFGEPWYFLENGEDTSFWGGWKWAYLRNNSWNWNNQVVVQETGKEIVVKSHNEGIYPELEHRRIKWEILKDDEVFYDGWNVNQGDRISVKYSMFGKCFTIYEIYKIVNGEIKVSRYWRYSYAGRKGKNLWNIKLGFNQRGEALLDVKRTKFRNEYISHWTPQDLKRHKKYVWLS